MSDDDDRLPERGRLLPQHPCGPDVNFLEPAECAGGLRQSRLESARVIARRLLGSANGGGAVLDCLTVALGLKAAHVIPICFT